LAERSNPAYPVIITTKIETELGIMVAGALDEGICLLEFGDTRPFALLKQKFSLYLL
jgi:hypothetical protein